MNPRPSRFNNSRRREVPLRRGSNSSVVGEEVATNSFPLEKKKEVLASHSPSLHLRSGPWSSNNIDLLCQSHLSRRKFSNRDLFLLLSKWKWTRFPLDIPCSEDMEEQLLRRKRTRHEDNLIAPSSAQPLPEAPSGLQTEPVPPTPLELTIPSPKSNRGAESEFEALGEGSGISLQELDEV